MSGEGAKRLIVGAVEYTIDESAGIDIAAIVTSIEEALRDGGVAKVPVRDQAGRRLILLLNGRLIDQVAIGLDDGPRPGEMSP